MNQEFNSHANMMIHRMRSHEKISVCKLYLQGQCNMGKKLLAFTPTLSKHIKTKHSGFSAPSASLGASSSERGNGQNGLNQMMPQILSKLMDSLKVNWMKERHIKKNIWTKTNTKDTNQSWKKQRINVIFYYSTVKLTQDMENVLNRGLNIAILPLNLDLTQVLTDFKRFERTMIWKEFWYGRENENGRKIPMFKQKKTIYHAIIKLIII